MPMRRITYHFTHLHTTIALFLLLFLLLLVLLFPQRLNLAPEIFILALELQHLCLNILHPLRCPDTKLLDNLDKAPEPEDDDNGCDFLEDALGQDVDNEARDDDEGVEAVEPVVEESFLSGAYVLSKLPQKGTKSYKKEKKENENGKQKHEHTYTQKPKH